MCVCVCSIFLFMQHELRIINAQALTGHVSCCVLCCCWWCLCACLACTAGVRSGRCQLIIELVAIRHKINFRTLSAEKHAIHSSAVNAAWFMWNAKCRFQHTHNRTDRWIFNWAVRFFFPVHKTRPSRPHIGSTLMAISWAWKRKRDNKMMA